MTTRPRLSRVVRAVFHPAFVTAGFLFLSVLAARAHVGGVPALVAVRWLWAGGAVGWWLGVFLRREIARADARVAAADLAAAVAAAVADADRGALLRVNLPALALESLESGIIEGASKQFAAQVGTVPDVLTGHAFGEFVHPDDLAATSAAVAALAPGEYMRDFRNRWPADAPAYLADGPAYLAAGAPWRLIEWHQLTQDRRTWKGRDVTADAEALAAEAARADDAEARAKAEAERAGTLESLVGDQFKAARPGA